MTLPVSFKPGNAASVHVSIFMADPTLVCSQAFAAAHAKGEGTIDLSSQVTESTPEPGLLTHTLAPMPMDAATFCMYKTLLHLV